VEGDQHEEAAAAPELEVGALGREGLETLRKKCAGLKGQLIEGLGTQSGHKVAASVPGVALGKWIKT